MAPPYNSPVNPNDSFWNPAAQQKFEDDRERYTLGRYQDNIPNFMTNPTMTSTVGSRFGNPVGQGFMNTFKNDFQWGGSANPTWKTYQHGLDEANLNNTLAQTGNDPTIVDRLGGYGNMIGLGAQLWGLKQGGDRIDNLQQYRGQMNQRAGEALALDRKKMGLVEDDYGQQKIIRKANMWAQRPQDENANPFTNQIVSQEA